MLRFPGTYVPGLIRYGSYGLQPNREFWAVYRPSEVLVLRMANWDYGRAVLGVNEPHRIAASLTDVG